MPKTIKILHVLHAFSPGGLENGVVNLINGSPDHFVHELCFLSRSGEFLQRLQRPVRYHELHKREGNDLSLFFRLRQIFQQTQMDIVHTRNWGAFDGVLAACLTRRPVLIHGEHGRDLSDPEGSNKSRNLARRTLAFRTKKVIAVSRDLYRWLKDIVRLPERKLVFIPNGVDTDRFHPGKNAPLRREFGIDENEFVIGTISRLERIKNHAGLIRAVQRINQGAQKVRLMIVGDGPDRPYIEQLVRSYPTTPAPILAGYTADAASYYRLFDAFALNSVAEGMSNTLLEAMSSGLPTVCTAVGGNPELIANDRRGILVGSGADSELEAAISEYAESPQLRAVHGANARQFVQDHFSLREMVQRYVGLYETVTS
jgi:sugar transferase (PEP-CTERM/EpsH1 system associated)